MLVFAVDSLHQHNVELPDCGNACCFVVYVWLCPGSVTAETAVWVEGETGTEEAARKAKAERAVAYMALIATVDALIEERSN